MRRFYVAISILYFCMALLVASLYYWPEAAELALYNAWEDPQIAFESQQNLGQIGIIAEQGSFVSPIAFAGETVAESSTSLQIRVFVDVDRLIPLIPNEPGYLTWLALLGLIGGQLLLGWSYAYYREWATKMVVAVLVVSVMLVRPSAQAFTSYPDELLPQAGDVLTYKLSYQLDDPSIGEDLRFIVPVPRGTVYVPETILVSQQVENDLIHFELATDVADADAGWYDLDRRQVVVQLPDDAATKGYIAFKFKVKEGSSVPEQIHIKSVGDRRGNTIVQNDLLIVLVDRDDISSLSP